MKGVHSCASLVNSRKTQQTGWVRWKRGGHQEVGGSPPALTVSDSTEERSKFKEVHLVKSCPVSLLVRMLPFPRKMPLSDIPQPIKKSMQLVELFTAAELKEL